MCAGDTWCARLDKERFNAGVLSLQPSMPDFVEMIADYRNDTLYKEEGPAEQGLLNWWVFGSWPAATLTVPGSQCSSQRSSPLRCACVFADTSLRIGRPCKQVLQDAHHVAAVGNKLQRGAGSLLARPVGAPKTRRAHCALHHVQGNAAHFAAKASGRIAAVGLALGLHMSYQSRAQGQVPNTDARKVSRTCSVSPPTVASSVCVGDYEQ